MNIDKIRRAIVIIPFCLIFSGCSVSGELNSKNSYGGIMKSADGGKSWFVETDSETNKKISSFNVLSLVLDSENPEIVYFGTKNKGLFFSENGSRDWRKINLSIRNIYSIATRGSGDDKEIYVSGVHENTGKIFKSLGEKMENWEVVYTEPSKGTMITSMAISRDGLGEIYAGTNEGVIVKTEDGGKSWMNIYEAHAPISKIDFDKNGGVVYFLVFEKDLLFLSDFQTGEVKSFFENFDSEELSGKKSLTFSVSDERGGIYLGTNNGIFKLNVLDGSVDEINSIGSSRKYPARSILSTSKDGSVRIFFGSAQVIYSSFDDGKSWFVSQVNSDGFVSNIVSDYNDPDIIYSSFRKK